MGLKEWIIPQEKKFFDMFIAQAKKIQEGVLLLQDIMHNNFDDIEEKRAKLKEIEHETDKIVHHIFHELNRSFITPIDKEDISKLASTLDDIIDNIYVAVNRICLYKIDKPSDGMKEFSQCLADAMKEINHIFSFLRNLNNVRKISASCIEVHRIENYADDLQNKILLNLFKEQDPIDIIKLKDIYSSLEFATDKCEHVAIIVHDILVKHG
ncbi:DUF47 family protein [Candidatus Woesearchaeota archaeon]|nr:DUF47 family protein [Candidatus Woesearchaeota archaeon]